MDTTNRSIAKISTVPVIPLHRNGHPAASYVPKSFYWLGIAIIVLCSAVALLPIVFGFLVNFQGYIMGTGILWIAIALFKLKLPLRLPFPLVMLFVLQAWIAVDGVIIGLLIGRIRPFNLYDTYLIRYCIYPFIVVSILTYLYPKSRTIITTIVMTCASLSVIAGFVQFLAPSLWTPFERFLGPALTGGRPCGLNGMHPHFAIIASFAAAILAARAMVRKISVKETLFFLFLAPGSFIAQARTHLPGLAITCLVFLIGLYIHDRKKALVMTGVVTGLTLLALLVFPHRFTIVLNTNIKEDPNFSARVNNTWPQAEYIQEKLPWTGIGSEPVFAGDLQYGRDKWAPLTAFDSGYLLIRSCYGYIGMAIVVLILGGGIWAIVGFSLRKRGLSLDRSAINVASGLMSISVAISMYANNVVTWQDAMTFLFVVAGMGVMTKEEMTSEQRRLIPDSDVSLLPRNA